MSDSAVPHVEFPIREDEPGRTTSDVTVEHDGSSARSIRDWISSLKREL